MAAAILDFDIAASFLKGTFLMPRCSVTVCGVFSLSIFQQFIFQFYFSCGLCFILVSFVFWFSFLCFLVCSPFQPQSASPVIRSAYHSHRFPKMNHQGALTYHSPTVLFKPFLITTPPAVCCLAYLPDISVLLVCSLFIVKCCCHIILLLQFIQ